MRTPHGFLADATGRDAITNEPAEWLSGREPESLANRARCTCTGCGIDLLNADGGMRDAFGHWCLNCAGESVTSDGPAKPRSKAAERQARYRASRGRSITVILPPDLADAFSAYMDRQAKDGAALTQSEVIAKLLRQQLLRKR